MFNWSEILTITFGIFLSLIFVDGIRRSLRIRKNKLKENFKNSPILENRDSENLCENQDQDFLHQFPLSKEDQEDNKEAFNVNPKHNTSNFDSPEAVGKLKTIITIPITDDTIVNIANTLDNLDIYTSFLFRLNCYLFTISQDSQTPFTTGQPPNSVQISTDSSSLGAVTICTIGSGVGVTR